MSIRRIKYQALRKLRIQIKRREKLWFDEMVLWDRITPVGREFGSPDYERLEREAIEGYRSHEGRAE